MDIQWYPGHMTKARRKLAPKLKMIDMVIEVLDARAPLSSLNPDFDDMFASKIRLFILNKSDLANPKVTKKWIEYFKSKGIWAIEFSAVKADSEGLKKKIRDASLSVLKKYEAKGAKKTLRLLVAGIPNVGKSAILNRLCGQRKMKEGNKPGVTKALQWAKIDDYLEILDMPGLLWPKFKDEQTGAVVALIGSIKLDILDEESLAYYLLKYLKMSEPQCLLDRYKLDELNEDAFEILNDICKSRGFLLRGGVYDTDRGAKTLLDDFKNGKMGRISIEIPPTE